MENIDKPTYDEKYCEIHKHYYAEFLKECPICLGERMVKENE